MAPSDQKIVVAVFPRPAPADNLLNMAIESCHPVGWSAVYGSCFMKRFFALATVSIFAVCLTAASPLARADENYVPRGHAYAPGDVFLPPLNSEADRINGLADAREAEIQRQAREQRIFQEQFQQHIDLHEFRPGRPYSPF
jgi:hypothetical protein